MNRVILFIVHCFWLISCANLPYTTYSTCNEDGLNQTDNIEKLNLNEENATFKYQSTGQPFDVQFRGTYTYNSFLKNLELQPFNFGYHSVSNELLKDTLTLLVGVKWDSFTEELRNEYITIPVYLDDKIIDSVKIGDQLDTIQIFISDHHKTLQVNLPNSPLFTTAKIDLQNIHSSIQVTLYESRINFNEESLMFKNKKGRLVRKYLPSLCPVN